MNERIRNKLIDLAVKNPGIRNRVKMSAGIVYRNRLISYGINQYKTHPMMMNNAYRDGQIFLHAEVDAIKNALKKINTDDLSKCDLYVVRVKRPHRNSKSYVAAMAKPCEGCCSVINAFGINNIYYTMDE